MEAELARAEQQRVRALLLRHQLVELHAAAEERVAVVGVAREAGRKEIRGGERVGEHLHVDAALGDPGESLGAGHAGHEVGRDDFERVLGGVHHAAERLDQPVVAVFAEGFLRRVRVDGHVLAPAERLGVGEAGHERCALPDPVEIGLRCGADRGGCDLRAEFGQVGLAVAGERLDRQHNSAVPESVEDRLRLGGGRTDRHHVEVAEVVVVGGVEVVVADVAAADDRHPRVRDPRLVVHAARGAEETQQHFQSAPERVLPRPRRVEHPYFDVLVAVEREVGGDAAVRGEVVEEESHAHAAVGCLQHLVGEEMPGQVALPDVVHEIEAAAGGARHQDSRGEGVVAVRQHEKATLVGAPGKQRGRGAIERSVGGGNGQRGRGRAQRALRELAVGIDGGHRERGDNARDRQDDEQYAQGNPEPRRGCRQDRRPARH